jgi:HEPN domain-containing protein
MIAHLLKPDFTIFFKKKLQPFSFSAGISQKYLKKNYFWSVEDKIENVQNIVSYWKTSSDQDYKTMHHLKDSRDYHWALFLGHLVLEKLLKANYVSKFQKHAIFTHDLLRLAEKAEIDFDAEWTDWLDEISTFNLNARYDNYKQDFYRRASQDFTTLWIGRIEIIREWLMKKL